MAACFVDASTERNLIKYDYCDNYKKLKGIIPTLGYTIRGVPTKVVVKTRRLDEAIQAYKEYATLETVNVSISVSHEVYQQLAMSLPSAVEELSPYRVLCKCIEDRGLLFDKGCISILYNALDDHTFEGFEEALAKLSEGYKQGMLIDKKYISRLFYVQDVVYPRQVMIAFLTLRRNRWRLLRMCLQSFPNDMVYFTIRKNVETFLTSKAKYLTTGQATAYVKIMPAKNLALLYKLFCLNNSCKDVKILLNLYEGGLATNYDLL